MPEIKINKYNQANPTRENTRNPQNNLAEGRTVSFEVYFGFPVSFKISQKFSQQQLEQQRDNTEHSQNPIIHNPSIEILLIIIIIIIIITVHIAQTALSLFRAAN